MAVLVEWEIKGTEFAVAASSTRCRTRDSARQWRDIRLTKVTLEISVSMVCAPPPCGGGPARSMRVTG